MPKYLVTAPNGRMFPANDVSTLLGLMKQGTKVEIGVVANHIEPSTLIATGNGGWIVRPLDALETWL